MKDNKTKKVLNPDIVKVIGEFVNLKKKGRNWFGLCPFHKEKKWPSFSVNPQKQIFHCFGCGAGGDTKEFLNKYKLINIVQKEH